MSLTIDPTGVPNDPRLTPEQAKSDGPRRGPHKAITERENDAAHVSISAQAASQNWAATQAENVAAAQGQVEDIDQANALVKQLVGQIASQPGASSVAQANVAPRAALNLLI
jgi:hypothetical protein